MDISTSSQNHKKWRHLSFVGSESQKNTSPPRVLIFQRSFWPFQFFEFRVKMGLQAPFVLFAIFFHISYRAPYRAPTEPMFLWSCSSCQRLNKWGPMTLGSIPDRLNTYLQMYKKHFWLCEKQPFITELPQVTPKTPKDHQSNNVEHMHGIP